LDLFDTLSRQPVDNPDQMSFDAAIRAMAEAEGDQASGGQLIGSS
jgi:hypothetical protein